MKSIYVAELNEGDDLLNEAFLLQDVIQRETKDGRAYLLCTFRDRTGQVSGVFWNVPADVEDWAQAGMLALVTGRITHYKGSPQINVTDLNPLHTEDMSPFLPSSQRTAESMLTELQQLVGQMEEPWQELVRRILLAPDFVDRFAQAPAARMMHHAYVGGLLEHTLSMAQLANHLADHYSYVNKSLLLAGTLLHDVGKVEEYSTEGNFSPTDDGRLIGHIVRGTIMIERTAAELNNLSEHQLRQLTHLIISHHGTQEFGSPVVPKTLEAILLHQIDLLDSRIQGFYDHLRNDNSSNQWTSKSSYMFNTELRRPPEFE